MNVFQRLIKKTTILAAVFMMASSLYAEYDDVYKNIAALNQKLDKQAGTLIGETILASFIGLPLTLVG